MPKTKAWALRLETIISTFVEKRKYSQAIDDLIDLQKEAGSEDRIVYYLGLCYANINEYDPARECLEYISSSDQLSIIQQIQVFMLLGMIYTDNENYQKAEESLKTAIDINPQSSMSYSALGYVYYLVKKYDMAIYNFKKAIQIDPNNASAHNNLGYTYCEIGINISEAIVECRKAVSLNPASIAYRDSLGWAYFTNGNFKDAGKELEFALDLLTEAGKKSSGKLFEKTQKIINEHLGKAISKRDYLN